MMKPTLLIVALIACMAGCHRSAEAYEGGDDAPDEEEFAELRIDACEAVCGTMDTCEPDRFVGMDPPDCFERCMTLQPRLYMPNQCGSREIQWMTCLGEVTCEEFADFEYAASLMDYYFDYPCVAEWGHAVECDEDEPFDLSEDNSNY